MINFDDSLNKRTGCSKQFVYCHQLSSVLTAAAQKRVSTPAPTHALLCSNLVPLKPVVQKVASASMETCLMGRSVCLIVNVGVFFMVFISR